MVMNTHVSSNDQADACILDFAEDWDIGRRERQEDFGMFVPMGHSSAPCRDLLYVLSDGMGGYAGGEIASNIVVRAFVHAIRESEEQELIPARLLQALQAADAALAGRKRREGPQLASMGCTLSCVWIRNNRLYHMGVGDSPIYLMRANRLYLVNRLHNHREDTRRKAQAEGLDWESIGKTPEMLRCGGMITSYLSGAGISQVDLPEKPVHLEAGDSILVASDGILTLTATEIARALRTDSVCDRTAARDVAALLDLVLSKNKPTQDNVSAGLIRSVSEH